MHPRTPVAAAIDTAIVVAFVSIGRRNHDEDEGEDDAIRTRLMLVSTTVDEDIGGRRRQCLSQEGIGRRD